MSIKIMTTVYDAADTPLQVEVKASQTSPRACSKAEFGLGETLLSVQAVATIVGKPNICVLALDPAASGTIMLQKQAKIVGQNCAIYSNSTHSQRHQILRQLVDERLHDLLGGRQARRQGQLLAGTVCRLPALRGPPCRTSGAVGRRLRAPPDLVITNQTTTLSPGTYCGGLSISGHSSVTFAPGVYILKDGPLNVAGSSTIQGAGVGFYFNTDDATFTFETGTTVDLSAPKTGEMAGLLFFGSRSQTMPVYKIFSDHARQLLGTIYLPQGEISIDANQPIADQSAYTAIVARKLTANSGPTVMLNTNYDAL